MTKEWLDAAPNPTAEEHLRNAVLSVLDADGALRAAASQAPEGTA